MPVITSTAYIASDQDSDGDILDHLAGQAAVRAEGAMAPGTRVKIATGGAHDGHIVRNLAVVLYHDAAKRLVDVLGLTPAGGVLAWRFPADKVAPLP